MAHYFENNEMLKSDIKENRVKIKNQDFIFYTDGVLQWINSC